MLDCHIHIEREPYTLAWIQQFVDAAQRQGLDEIYLLEHCYRFREFVPMYDAVCAYSPYIDTWFHRKAGVLDLADYCTFIDRVRRKSYPVKIKFGLEVCYFEEFTPLVKAVTEGKDFDFLTGSIHFIDRFAFDHKAEFWENVNVDEAYRRYFADSISLAQSGLYTGIGHPDCIKLFGHKPSFPLNCLYEQLADELLQNNLYAEESSGCHRRTGVPLGMEQIMLHIFKEKGVRILTASDAHRPEEVGAFIPEMEHILTANTNPPR